MKIFIGADHRGKEIGEKIYKNIKKLKYEVVYSELDSSEEDDYVDFAYDVAKNVKKSKNNVGILICGTGIGMSIAANKVKGAYAARCVSESDAFYARNHNGANIICLGEDLGYDKIYKIVIRFLLSDIAYEERHIRRINKIKKIEDK